MGPRFASKKKVKTCLKDRTTLTVCQLIPRRFMTVDLLHFSFCDQNGKRQSRTIPAGFLFDGGSIPRPLWTLVGVAPGHILPATCVHDYLYQSGQASRYVADQKLREDMRVLGLNSCKVRMIYWAVRLFGHGAYLKGSRAAWYVWVVRLLVFFLGLFVLSSVIIFFARGLESFYVWLLCLVWLIR